MRPTALVPEIPFISSLVRSESHQELDPQPLDLQPRQVLITSTYSLLTRKESACGLGCAGHTTPHHWKARAQTTLKSKAGKYQHYLPLPSKIAQHSIFLFLTLLPVLTRTQFSLKRPGNGPFPRPPVFLLSVVKGVTLILQNQLQQTHDCGRHQSIKCRACIF